jgi:hypothetical protein
MREARGKYSGGAQPRVFERYRLSSSNLILLIARGAQDCLKTIASLLCAGGATNRIPELRPS